MSRARRGLKNHRCEKSEIDWDPKISQVFVNEDGVGWFGTCGECGRRVYEIYEQCGGLHDAKSHKEVGYVYQVPKKETEQDGPVLRRGQ